MSHFAGQQGLAGWQWLFLLEGLPSLVLGIVCFFYLPNDIRSAKWLSEPEKLALEARIQNETGEKHHHSLRDMFAEPKVWMLAVIYAFFLMGLYGVSFWLPSLVKAAGVEDPLKWACSPPSRTRPAWSRCCSPAGIRIGSTSAAGTSPSPASWARSACF